MSIFLATLHCRPLAALKKSWLIQDKGRTKERNTSLLSFQPAWCQSPPPVAPTSAMKPNATSQNCSIVASDCETVGFSLTVNTRNWVKGGHGSAWIFSTTNFSLAADGSSAFLHITVLLWVHETVGGLVCDSYLDRDGSEPSRTFCKPLMHCSNWTEKKASIDFDRNWATFMVNFARTTSSLQRFAPSRLAEGEMRFFLQSEIHCSVGSRYMLPRWEMTPRFHMRRYLGRRFIQLLNHLFLRMICAFFFFVRASSSNFIFISTSSYWKKKKVLCLCGNVIFSHDHNSKRWFSGEWNNQLFVTQPFHDSDGIYPGIQQQGQLAYNANDNGIVMFLFYEKDLFNFKLPPPSKFNPSCHFPNLLALSEQPQQGGSPPATSYPLAVPRPAERYNLSSVS